MFNKFSSSFFNYLPPVSGIILQAFPGTESSFAKIKKKKKEKVSVMLSDFFFLRVGRTVKLYCFVFKILKSGGGSLSCRFQSQSNDDENCRCLFA